MWNTFLWGTQIVLAIKFTSVAVTHGLLPDQTKLRPGWERWGTRTRPMLVAIAVGAVCGALGLIAPAVLSSLSWVMPFAAGALAAMLLAAVALHRGCRAQPNDWVNLILFALAVFVLAGRLTIAPL